jgi:hypothetical protein
MQYKPKYLSKGLSGFAEYGLLGTITTTFHFGFGDPGYSDPKI